MIKQHFLIPQYYVQKQAYCDNCNVPLQDNGTILMRSSPQVVMQCPKCAKTYNINENDLQGEWKWRTI